MSNPAWNNQNIATCGGDNSAPIGNCLAGQNGGLPTCAIVNYGDSVVIWDSWSRYGNTNGDQLDSANGFVGTNTSGFWSYVTKDAGSAQAFQVFCANEQQNLVPMTSAGTPTPVQFGDKVIFWANGYAIYYGGSKLEAYQISLAELQQPVATNTWNNLVWILNVQPLQTQWNFGPPYKMDTCIYANYFSSFSASSPSFNPVTGQGSPANIMFIQSLGNQSNYFSSVDTSNHHCGTAPCWSLRPFNGSHLYPTPSIITLFLVANACNFNQDCGDASGNTFCVNNKCYSNNQSLYPALSGGAMSSSCQAGIGNSTSNNMISPACQAFCSYQAQQCVIGTNQSACSYANSCDQQMINYCQQTYGNTVPQAVNGIANPCTCIQASIQTDSGGDLVNPEPQCFYPGCVGCPAGVYCTQTMTKDFTPAQCSGACGVVINCQQAGTCQVVGDKICEYCESTAPAGSCGGGGGPTGSGGILDWIKSHVLEASLIGGGVGLLILIVLALVLFKKKKTSS